MTAPRDVHERPRRWRRRVAALATMLAITAAVILVVLGTLRPGAATTAVLAAPLRVRALANLATPVQGAAAVQLASGEGMLVVGGLDQAGAAVDAIQRVAGSKATVLGTLPTAVRDAAAVRIGKAAYLLGGAGAPGGDAILELPDRPGAPVTQLAALPQPVSDAAAAVLDGAAFVFGGFTGDLPTGTVLAWAPGGRPHATASLPARLIYAAAATVGGVVIIAGGIVDGAPTRTILSFDLATHSLTPIGQLPVALSHAGAGVIGGQVFVVGGRGARPNSQTRAIYRIDPNTGGASYAGVLPVPISDPAVATSDGRILVAGGVNRSGQVQRAVYELSLS
jgi:N-acetylneuraminic acid mutarotase